MADSKQFTARPIIVKIGGGREINTEGIARELATLKQPTLVVLGANAIRDEVARKTRSANSDPAVGVWI